jgi:hypothetical protein
VTDQPTRPAAIDPASLTPVDVDGVRAVTIGTVLWAIALIALLPFWSKLDDDGHLWWIATCAAGVVLGLLGLLYVTRRRAAIRRSQQ